MGAGRKCTRYDFEGSNTLLGRGLLLPRRCGFDCAACLRDLLSLTASPLEKSSLVSLFFRTVRLPCSNVATSGHSCSFWTHRRCFVSSLSLSIWYYIEVVSG